MKTENLGNYPYYVERYLALIQEDDLFIAFENQGNIIVDLFAKIEAEKASTSYAPGKWTIKELVQHCIDAERIFCYRALCFARKETTSLPGFDENQYAANSFANEREWESIIYEFFIVREATKTLFESFQTSSMQSSGIANGNESSVISIGFLILGHFQHHINIIKERYLV